MKKQLAVLLLGLGAVLVAAGQLAHAAVQTPPTPEDTQPYWSFDARTLVYAEQTQGFVQTRAVPAGHGASDAVAIGKPRGFEPGGAELLVESEGTVTVTSTSATPIRSFDGTLPTWSPDGSRIAYVDPSDRELRVQDATGLNVRVAATAVQPPSWEITGPAWSPDGKQVVVSSGSTLVLANADGSGSHVLFSGANQSVDATWSPDGTLIAFERNAGTHWAIWTVHPDGTDAHQQYGSATSNYRYPRFSPVSGKLAYISDRQHVPGGATQFQFALYDQAIGAAKPNKLVDDVHPYSAPAWSPTGAQLAVAAGQECLRWGIYVVRDVPFPASSHRLSNLCRFEGTARADTIAGTPWHDILRGFGGNDSISGGAGADRIEGNDGNDVIRGGIGNDVIFGGNGDDRISGGNGNDLIIGGNGHDRIDCGAGNDRVEGAGPFDTVAKNCEHVSRS